MNNIHMLAEEEENDDATKVTWEVQQCINTFSKLNTYLRGIEDRLEDIRQGKEAIDDLAAELELTDQDQLVRYKIGEFIFHLPLPRALDRLAKDRTDIAAQLAHLSTTADECEKGMEELKVALYAKFGRAINLDE
ncbi:Prefoldin, subunit 4 [Imleria badia]|nr:Prefoldin, subunit 4 [Imleria badia]